MRVDPYKLGWLLITILIVSGLGIGIYFLAAGVASHQPPGVAHNVPSYQKVTLGGPKVISLPPYQPSAQGKKSPINIPPQDKNLLPQGLPASSAIKAPDKPAMPPNENNIIRVMLSSQAIKPTTIKTQVFQPVILRVQSRDDDYIFFIEKIGIAEVIRKDQSLTISFRAPAKATSLRYYYKDYKTRKLMGEGEIIVD